LSRGWLAADFEADVADGLLVCEKGWLATEDFKKPGFCEKPGFCWAKTPKNIRLNVGRGQSIRTETFMLFIKTYRPNAIAPTA